MAKKKNDLVIDDALASLYTKTFESPEGKQVLEDLMLRFHALDGIVPPSKPGVAPVPVDPVGMAMSVGNQQVVLHILACIEGNKVGRFRELTARAMTPK
jgi:hypothetical protein